MGGEGPDGHVYFDHLHDSECKAQKWFAFDRWQETASKGYRCIRVRITEVQDGGPTMGEVKRFTPDTFGDGVVMVEVRADDRYETSDETEFCEARDVARLERERDEAREALAALESNEQNTMNAELTRLRTERDQAMAAHADMVREVEASQAEMARLRAVEAEAQAVIETSVCGRTSDGSRYYMTCPEDMRALAEACGRRL